jgi:hypothetical protein
VSSLGDPKQALSPARGVLSGRKTEPNSELSSVLKLSTVACGGGDSSRYDGPTPLRKPLCGRLPDCKQFHVVDWQV